MSMNALAGIKVLDLSHVIAGPTASHYLALEGAEVIKVEPPKRGDVLRHGRPGQTLDTGVSVGFAAINGGKRSLAIDLKRPESRPLVEALIAQCDVFIENYRPGAAARLGLGPEDVTRIRPDIVYASISGFGQQGEWAGRPAYDHVVQSAMGMSSLQGDATQDPMKVGFPVVDTATGMVAAQAITTALLRRLRTGQGARLDISMAQAALQLMWPEVAKVAHSGEDSPRVGNRGFTGSPGAATFACADGWLSTAANTPTQFRALCDVLDLPALPDDPVLIDQPATKASGFVAARDASELHNRLASAMRRLPLAPLEAALSAHAVPCAPVRTLSETLATVTTTARMTLPQRHTAYPGGTVCDFGAGYLADGMPGAALAPAPRHGQHTGEILATLGLPPDEIQRLHALGVVNLG